MRVLFVAIAAAALATSGGAAVASTPDQWAKLARPLHLPRIAPDSRCPVSHVDRLVDWRAANIFGGVGVGSGPVYPGGVDSSSRLNTTPDRQFGGRWRGQKVF